MLAQHFKNLLTDRSDGTESHLVVTETGPRGPDCHDGEISAGFEQPGPRELPRVVRKQHAGWAQS